MSFAERPNESAKRPNCPRCRYDSLKRVLDLPKCQRCGWTGRVAVDANWKRRR